MAPGRRAERLGVHRAGRRGPLRGAEPVAARGRRAGRRARRLARRRAGRVRARSSVTATPSRRRSCGCSWRGLGAVPGGRHAAGALGGDRAPRSSGCGRWPPRRCWRSSSSGWKPSDRRAGVQRASSRAADRGTDSERERRSTPTSSAPQPRRALGARRRRLGQARRPGPRRGGCPCRCAMVDALRLQPGQRVLELAAGPGDTGFLAAELIAPGRDADLQRRRRGDARRSRASARRAQRIDNVEFRQLELEWIDLPTASVDAVLCRWGIMLIVDPDAAAREIRRVLRPGGRAALAVWDDAERNPWATIPTPALIELGHAEPPDPAAPGHVLARRRRRAAGPARGRRLHRRGGRAGRAAAPRPIRRRSTSPRRLELSPMLRGAFGQLSDAEQRPRQPSADRRRWRARVRRRRRRRVVLPGSSLVASAIA